MSEITNTFTQEQEAWLHTLETTDLPQGEASLKAIIDGEGGRYLEYCCLGIACDLVLHMPHKLHDNGIEYDFAPDDVDED